MRDVLYTVEDKVRDGIEIASVFNGDGMRIHCDREYMRMCLINLILNSAQAIEDKGHIVVRFAAAAGAASISVTDDGKGVEGDMERIFEPYYSTKKLGIGLGLTITKRLGEEHGGTISAESVAGERTVVTIKVPDYAAS
jgi:signal transduction histidine kinase